MLQAFQQLFTFQNTQVASPPATFGSVMPTEPPGLILSRGVHVLQDQNFVPIRFISIDSRRIVIDIAGPSSDIDPIFERINEVFGNLRATDGSPVIGTPSRTLDQSEMSMRFPFSPTAVLAVPLLDVLSKTFKRAGDEVFIPILAVRSAPASAEYLSTTVDMPVFQFELRAGVTPQQRLYYSSALLDSDAHLQLLRHLAGALESETS